MFGYGADYAARKARSLLATAILVAISTGAVAYVVRSIKYAGRAEVEMQQLERINKNLVKDNKRLEKVNTRMARNEKAMAGRIEAAAAEAAARKAALDEIPREEGEVICPINCKLPQ